MSSQHDQFRCEKFPEQCSLILHLAADNEEFMGFVRHNADSRMALSKWKISNCLKAGDHVREYTVLKEELELEIREFLHLAVKSAPR